MKTDKAIYPGTFDPITFGHIDLIKRASSIFDELVIAVVRGSVKQTLFSADERTEMVKNTIRGMRNVKVEIFDGLVVDYARRTGAKVMVRGLRMLSDFEYEFQMALTNRKLRPSIETIFMMPREDYSYISSKLIKEAAALGADLCEFVPRKVAEALGKKLSVRKGGGKIR